MKRNSITVLIFVAFVFVAFYISLALSVDNSITYEDEQAIETLRLSSTCENVSASYEKELECLFAIQAAVQSIGEFRCAVASDIIEPSEFLRRNYGCCFDRARFIEKAARYYGFKTRHVFLIKPYKGLSATIIFPLGQSSHATSEILTTRGWLGVDSNEPFLLLSQSGIPTTYRDAINDISNFSQMEPSDWYAEELDVIYGLYSRHGNFHGRNFPGPEYVFGELLWNWY